MVPNTGIHDAGNYYFFGVHLFWWLASVLAFIGIMGRVVGADDEYN